MKDVLFRLSEKRRVPVTLVANQYLATPKSAPLVQSLQVPAGFDVADNEIVKRLAEGDLVITADVPLADEVLGKGAVAINPRGTLYTPANVKDHLSRRDLFTELRDAGTVQGGQRAYDKKHLQDFSNALDRVVTKALNAAG